jgi:hypothetical protein
VNVSPAGSGGAQYGSPACGAVITSSIAAASVTVRAIGPITDSMVTSVATGPRDTLPRLGLRPTSPHTDAGMRIEPPPSLACAKGTRRPATADAAPPEDPPASRPVSHGVTVGGRPAGSV